MGTKFRILLAVVLAQSSLLLPIAINQHLRRTYEFTLAHYRAKFIRPDRVMIGDSITAGGGDFGTFGTLNLGISGLHTAQIAAMLRRAREYNPRRIYVMAGTNDIIGGADPVTLATSWRTILAEPRVVVTLLPHTQNPAHNRRVDALNAMVAQMARKAGRHVIALPGLTGSDGTIQARYTVDGTHLTPPAYAIWRAQIG